MSEYSYNQSFCSRLDLLLKNLYDNNYEEYKRPTAHMMNVLVQDIEDKRERQRGQNRLGAS